MILDPFFDGMPPIVYSKEQDTTKWSVLSGQIIGHYAPKSPFYIWHNVVTDDDQDFYKSKILKIDRSEKTNLHNATYLNPEVTKSRIRSQKDDETLARLKVKGLE